MNAQVSFGSDLTYFRSISGGDRNFEGFGQFGFGLRLYRKFPEGPIESRRKGTMDGTFFDLLNINGFSIGLKHFVNRSIEPYDRTRSSFSDSSLPQITQWRLDYSFHNYLFSEPDDPVALALVYNLEIIHLKIKDREEVLTKGIGFGGKTALHIEFNLSQKGIIFLGPAFNLMVSPDGANANSSYDLNYFGYSIEAGARLPFES